LKKKLSLLILGVLVLAVYGALAVLLVGRLGTSPSRTAVLTAKEAYKLALAEAQAWQGDAQLVSGTASWNGVTAEQLLQEKAAWGFTFLSPQARQVRIVSVTEAGAAGVQTINATAQTRSADVSLWEVDSPHVLSLFLEHGGRTFLSEHPGATITVRLGRDEGGERLVWLAFGIDSSSDATLTVQVDTSNGEVMSPSS
jgi:type II secretory pathway pseudopilin PulG